MNHLSEDIETYLINQFLSKRDVYSLCCVSKRYNWVVEQSVVWKEKLKKNFNITEDVLINFPVQDFKKLFDKINKNFRYPLRSSFLGLLRSLMGTLNDKNTLSCILDIPQAFKETDDTINLASSYLKLALFCGSLKTVNFFLESFKLVLPNDSLQLASFSGSSDLIEYLLEKKFDWDEQSFQNLIASKNNDAIHQWVMPKLIYSYPMLKAAVSSGHLLMIQTLLKNLELKIKMKDLLLYSSQSGSEVLIQYLIKQYNFEPESIFLYSAIASNNYCFLRKIVEEYSLKPDILALRDAIMLPRLSIFKFLCLKFSIRPDITVLNCACEVGMVRNVRYLIETYNLNPNQSTLGKALYSNNAELVKYLFEKFGLTENAKKIIEKKYPRLWNALFFIQDSKRTCLSR